MTLKARVQHGRLIVNEPTELPEGTEVALLPRDTPEGPLHGDGPRARGALQEVVARQCGSAGDSSPGAGSGDLPWPAFPASARPARPATGGQPQPPL